MEENRDAAAPPSQTPHLSHCLIDVS